MARSTCSCLLAAVVAVAVAPAAAQEGQACADEVARLGEAFGVAQDGGEAEVAIARAPGARRGAELGAGQRREVAELIRRARRSGEQGDSRTCLQGLGQARALLREAGLGGGQPGTAAAPGLAGGGSAGSAGTPANLPAAGAAGGRTVPGTVGGGTATVPSTAGNGGGGSGGSSGGGGGGGG